MAEEAKEMETAAEAQTQAESSSGEEETNLLDRIVTEGRIAWDDSQKDYAHDLVGEFVGQVIDKKMSVSKNTVAMINRRIAEIDELLTRQVNEIMHAQDFQKIEASWRGLEFLVKNTETRSDLELRVMNVSKEELQEDLEDASEFDQSQLFKKVYEAEYGQFGGNPYSLLIGDYEFGRHPQDMELLKNMAQVAAAAHAPFVSAAGAELLGMKSFTEMGGPRDLAKKFES